jgi:tetratricopeptide (TPR) repeat protein
MISLISILSRIRRSPNFQKVLLILPFTIFVLSSIDCLSQEGTAGVENPFLIGVDARTLGLGNAAVAFPQDPSAFLWNPAGMVVVQQKSVLLSYTNLFEGIQYHSINYTHPTLTAGTFGLGVTRIGIGGIRHVEEIGGVPVDLGEMDYWWGKLVLAYGTKLFHGLSLGANFVVHRQVLGSASTYGFGMDAGIHYQIHETGTIFDNIYLGGFMDNALPARLKLGTAIETLPSTFRFGIAKAFYLRGKSDRWLFIADWVKDKYQTSKLHAGMEYAIQNSLFLRIGMNDKKWTFGGGLGLRYFQLDYASGQIGDPEFFPRSHRFSLIFFMGKSIPEQKRILEVRRQEEFQKKIEQEMEDTRQKRIQDGIANGKTYLASGDYFHARLEFGGVLREDPENIEAKQLLDDTASQEQAIQQTREQKMLEDARIKEAKQKDMAFVSQYFQEGLVFLDSGSFEKAIEKWKQALHLDTSNVQIQNYIDRAEETLNNEIQKLLGRARQLIRLDNLSEAYQVLRRAKELAGSHPKLSGIIASEMKGLDEKFGFLNAYQAGVQRYESQDYVSAAEFFKKAMELEPDNVKVKELYRNAQARAQGSSKKMSIDVKEKYSSGLRLYQAGDYQGALKVWEEALQIDPNNIKLLEAVQGARSRTEEFKRNR